MRTWHKRMVMMSKIIYLSNIDRRSIKMQTAIKDLQAEGLLSPDAVYLRVKTDSIWTEKMDRTLADADLVLMNRSSNIVHWRRCRAKALSPVLSCRTTSWKRR